MLERARPRIARSGVVVRTLLSDLSTRLRARGVMVGLPMLCWRASLSVVMCVALQSIRDQAAGARNLHTMPSGASLAACQPACLSPRH